MHSNSRHGKNSAVRVSKRTFALVGYWIIHGLEQYKHKFTWLKEAYIILDIYTNLLAHTRNISYYHRNHNNQWNLQAAIFSIVPYQCSLLNTRCIVQVFRGNFLCVLIELYTNERFCLLSTVVQTSFLELALISRCEIWPHTQAYNLMG